MPDSVLHKLHEARIRNDDLESTWRRDSLRQLEQAFSGQSPSILINGPDGVGKTHLARDFVRNLDSAARIDRALWFDFRQIHTVDHVVNSTGESLSGGGFRYQPDRIPLLIKAFGLFRTVIVWDHFEYSADNLTSEDRMALLAFIEASRGTPARILILSRYREEWIPASLIFELPLRSLENVESREYADALLRQWGLEFPSGDPRLTSLLGRLRGNPLAIRLALSLLPEKSVSEIAILLPADTDLSPAEWLVQLVRAFENNLPENLRPIMQLSALHQRFLNAGVLDLMSYTVTGLRVADKCKNFLLLLGRAGLAADRILNFEVHPVLDRCSRTRDSSEEAHRAFVDHMLKYSAIISPPGDIPFADNDSNFRYAMYLSLELGMKEHYTAIAFRVASYARSKGNFVESLHLYTKLIEQAKSAGELYHEAALYHEMGDLAREQRNVFVAREWYFKALSLSEQLLHGGAEWTWRSLAEMAHAERDFAAAAEWYGKALAYYDTHNFHYMAGSVHFHLAELAREQGDLEDYGRCLIRSISGYRNTAPTEAKKKMDILRSLLSQTSPEIRAKLEDLCRKAGMGALDERI